MSTRDAEIINENGTSPPQHKGPKTTAFVEDDGVWIQWIRRDGTIVVTQLIKPPQEPLELTRQPGKLPLSADA